MFSGQVVVLFMPYISVCLSVRSYALSYVSPPIRRIVSWVEPTSFSLGEDSTRPLTAQPPVDTDRRSPAPMSSKNETGNINSNQRLLYKVSVAGTVGVNSEELIAFAVGAWTTCVATKESRALTYNTVTLGALIPALHMLRNFDEGAYGEHAPRRDAKCRRTCAPLLSGRKMRNEPRCWVLLRSEQPVCR